MQEEKDLLPSISIVIVSYYTGPLLWRALETALEQSSVSQVILVDNGNWPHILTELKDMAATEGRLTLLTGHGNVGFAAGCNLGAKAAEGDILYISNPDAILPDSAVLRLYHEGQGKAGSKPWLIGGHLVHMDGKEQPGSRRNTLTPWTALVEMLRLDRLAPRHPYFRRFNNHLEPRPEKTIQTPVISGASMMTPRQDYFAIGGMDERYFLHVEDIDFCLRFREGGGEVYYCPHVDIVHPKSSSRVSKIKVERLKAQSMTRYFRRHFSTQYPMGFVSVVSGLIWVGFGIRSTKILLRRAFGVIGIHRRYGLTGAKRLWRKGKSSQEK